MNIKELCFALCEKAGTSGDEKAAAEYAKELLSEYMPAEIDILGNVVGKRMTVSCTFCLMLILTQSDL